MVTYRQYPIIGRTIMATPVIGADSDTQTSPIIGHCLYLLTYLPTFLPQVVSALENRSLPHLTSLVSSAIKRIIRKKHTKPNYTKRYGPLFPRPEPTLGRNLPTLTLNKNMRQFGVVHVNLQHLSNLNKQGWAIFSWFRAKKYGVKEKFLQENDRKRKMFMID